MPFGCLPLLIFFWLLILSPFFFLDAMVAAMTKLGFTPDTALNLVVWIFLGGMVNIPVHRIERAESMSVHPFMYLGLDRWRPSAREQPYTVVAVNVGGCLIPLAIVFYEILRLAQWGGYPLAATLIAVSVNVGVCYRVARPIPGIGIALPPLVPAAAAVFCAWILLPGLAAPVAFIAGVLGPLIGADLLHLRDIGRISTGMGSIGGAGTFDGIVLSGLFAVLLA